MKKTTISLCCFCLLAAGACNKQEKAQQHAPTTYASLSGTLTYDGVEVKDGIPYYASEDAFKRIYERLSASYESNLKAVGEAYYKEDLPEEVYDEMAWEVWEKGNQPLVDFENAVQLSSVRKYEAERYVAWLTSQKAEELDESTYPQSLAVSPVQKAMMSKEGDYAIGDVLYHMMQFSPTEVAILEIPGRENWGNLDGVKLQLLSARGSNLLGVIGEWRDKHVHFSNYKNDRDNPDPDCKSNMSQQRWIQVDNKTKFSVQEGMYYDFVKTSAVVKIEAHHKSRILGWIPALTNITAGMQRFDYNTDCGDRMPIFLGGTRIWGPWNVCQNNNWNVARTTKRAIFAPTAYPSEGLSGRCIVKTSDVYWSPMVW